MFWNSIGRINRPTYFLTLVILNFIWILMSLFHISGAGELLILMLTIPRLHDIGKSGWWAGGGLIALTLLILLGALTLPGRLHDEDLIGAAGGAAVLIVMGILVWLGCIRGKPGANAYGEAPAAGVSFKTYRLAKTSVPTPV